MYVDHSKRNAPISCCVLDDVHQQEDLNPAVLDSTVVDILLRYCHANCCFRCGRSLNVYAEGPKFTIVICSSFDIRKENGLETIVHVILFAPLY